MNQNGFGGWALPVSTGEVYSISTDPLAILKGEGKERGREMGMGEERGRKGNGEKEKGRTPSV